jgi:hypothetical protein
MVGIPSSSSQPFISVLFQLPLLLDSICSLSLYCQVTAQALSTLLPTRSLIPQLWLQLSLVDKILGIMNAFVSTLFIFACTVASTNGFNFNGRTNINSKSSLQMNDVRKTENKRDRSLAGILGTRNEETFDHVSASSGHQHLKLPSQ